MSRFKMNTVAVDVQNGLYGNYFRIRNAENREVYVEFKNSTCDSNGRLLGKVIDYSTKKWYLVDFGNVNESWEQKSWIKIKDCHTPLYSPAETCGRPKNKIVYGMIKARAWNEGNLETVYVEGKELHGGKAKIFMDYDGLNVVKGRTYLDGQNILYFLSD